jgi:diacylglycerol O-acyltransferase / wax synthase
MSDQLNALDATFLELEEADQGVHMHIGGVMVFEPRPDGRAPSVAEVVARIEEGLDILPRYRDRLSSPTTGGLSWPSWRPHERFRVANHVRAVSLPPPGGQAELLDWAGEFYSERLDRAQPLWEMVVVEGLAGGGWALATKTHHCMVDGVGSVDTIQLVLDSEPRPAPSSSPAAASSRSGPLQPPAPPLPLEALTSTAAGLARISARTARAPLAIARAGTWLIAGMLGAARHPERTADALRRSRALTDVIIRDEVAAAPRTSLNVPIGGKRRFTVAWVPLEELKTIKRSLGGTVNDVVLAIAAGGLRRLLIERAEPLPRQGLRAMVPVNLRAAGEELALGNRITSLFVHLPVAIEDPVERYRRQMEEAEDLKSGNQALGSSTLLDLTKHAPPVIHSFLARSLFATRLFNVTITNVPGPQFTLYGLGSKLTDIWPLVPLAADHAIGLAVLSYDGRVFFGLNADRDAMPDLDLLSEGIEDSFAELREAAVAKAGQSS